MKINTQDIKGFLPLFMLALGISLVFFASATFVFAQEDVATEDDTTEVEAEDVNTASGDADARRAELRDRADARRDDLRDRADDKRDNLRDRADDKRDDLREKVDVRRDELKEKREERRSALAEKRKERIKAFVARIIKRMNAALKRLSHISDRVEARIGKLEEARGIDLSEARALLADARSAIELATNEVVAVEEALRSALDSDTPKDEFSKVRELFENAKQSIKNAHKALVDAIRAVKASVSTDE